MSARIRTSVATILSILLGLQAQQSWADALDDAERLLRVSDTARHFQYAADKQTRDLLRTYSSIVAMTVDVDLPEHITASISLCYNNAYAWENFRPGIAEILSQHFSVIELRMLTNFYRNRGLAPWEIESFKLAIAKAPGIEEDTAEYIFLRSNGCVEQASLMINSFLRSLPARSIANADE